MKTDNSIIAKKELVELLDAKEQELKYNLLKYRFPDSGPYRRELYSKQLKFMAMGKSHPQRLLMGGNRVGKTEAGAYETVCHLTGEYPDWWEGHKFLNAITAWAVGVTNQSVKRVQQKSLLGPVGSFGTGLIPKGKIVGNPIRKPGVAGAIETVYVRHKSGNVSELTFMSYEQGRDSFQGTYIPWIWMDEEPKDYGIYEECLMRTMSDVIPGHIVCTFTPLFGMSKMVLSFLEDGRFPHDGVPSNDISKFVTQISWNDIPHLSEMQKSTLLKSISPHLRDARTKGIPSLGAGAIYPYPEDKITVEPFPIPLYWPRAYGLDVGWERTAAVWVTMDPESHQYYLYSEHYESGEENRPMPMIHASAIRSRGDWIWGAIDPASRTPGQADGKKLFELYTAEGLNLEIADNAVDAGIARVGQLLISGQMKVFNTLRNWLGEYRTYTRDEKGKIVKKNDHLMDATRYVLMACPTILREYVEYNAQQSIREDYVRDDITGY